MIQFRDSKGRDIKVGDRIHYEYRTDRYDGVVDRVRIGAPIIHSFIEGVKDDNTRFSIWVGNDKHITILNETGN